MKPIEMKRILAGIDFSDWTSPVLQTAAVMAQSFSARLTVVHAETFLPPPYFTRRGMDQIVDMLEVHRDEARRHLA